MSYTPGNPAPGPDNYGFSGEGSINRNNQSSGGDNNSPWLRGNDNPYAYNGTDQGWRNAGSMHFTSPDGREVFNIQNAYFPAGFNFSRAFGDQMAQDGSGQRWGGYNPADNPQYQGRIPMVNQEAARLAAQAEQNYYLQQQEQQMLNSGLYSQNGPMPNYFSSGYHHRGIPSYYHHRGPEFAANNPFYSGYYPGAPQPGFSINLGRHAFIRIGI